MDSGSAPATAKASSDELLRKFAEVGSGSTAKKGLSQLVKTLARVVEGDARKAICKESERIKPAAVVMGTRGRTLIQSVYCREV